MHNSVNASVVFGLTTVQVGVTPAAAEKSISFTTLHRKCGTKVTTQKECVTCGETHLSPDDLVSGYKYAKDQYVTFEKDMIAALKAERAPIIQIEQFVHLAEVPATAYKKTYYLTPPERAILAKPYVLLHDALDRERLAGVGRAALWGKERPCAIYALNGLLHYSTLFCGDELRDDTEAKKRLDAVTVSQDEIALADEFLRLLTVPFEPSLLHSESRTRIEEVVDARIQGIEVAPSTAEAEPEPTEDILASLRASIEAAKPKSKPRRAKTKA